MANFCRVRLIKTTKKLENLGNVSDEQTPVRGKRHVTLKSIRKKQLLFNLGLNVEESSSSSELGYLNLPDVVCKEIISYLSVKDIRRLLMTCKTISKLVTNHVWHHLIEKDFPNTNITVELSTKSIYASLCVLHLAHTNDVSNTQKRLELTAKGQWLKSDRRLKNFRIPEKRRKLKQSNEK